jgi:hypothetical protein
MKEKIIAKIYETCPELKALEFGCKVRYEVFPGTNMIVTITDEVQKNDENSIIFSDSDVCRIVEILGKEPQLNHLLRTINQNKNAYTAYTTIAPDDEARMFMGFIDAETEPHEKEYDLTKTVSENLENEALCSFLYKIICE